MNIGKASKLSELTVKAVRYYDNIGLVKSHQSISSGYREYNEEDVLKLKFCLLYTSPSPRDRG